MYSARIAGLIVLILGIASGAFALERGKLGISVSGGYVVPLGNLSDRFDAVVEGRGGLLYRWKEKVHIEWSFGYHQYDKNWNYAGDANTPAQSLDQILRMGHVMWNWHVLHNPQTSATPYFIGGVGFFYTEFTRAEFEADGDTRNGIHFVDYAMGGTLGLGLLLNQNNTVQFYAQVLYYLTLTELWPTLSIDMEKVNPIQSVSLNAGLRYHF